MSDPSRNPLRCLVTGGAGFIGSHVAEALLAAGHQVAILDNLSTGKRDYLPAGARFFECDITGDPSDGFRQFQPQVVFHLAAQVSVSFSVRHPDEDAQVNTLGSINILKMLGEYEVKKVVYASSGASYGPLETLPLLESMRPLPVSAYGASKHSVEHYLRMAGREHGLEWAALRYANVYGPRQDPHGEAGVVAIFIGKMLRGEQPAIFDDGELTRDYIYVEDVARANLAALTTDLRGHPDPIFNISTGRATTVNQLFMMLEEAMGGKTTGARRGPPRPGDVRHSVLDNRKASRELGFEPRIGLPEGLRRTVEFFKGRTAR
jgi:UDP-glucose 4-epimerase